ncbi:MAG: RNA polymerase sigma factor [Candidatus Rokuibacteriota bacterium]
MQEPDPEVIRAAAAHDVDAFDAIVRAYQPQVWRFLRHYLGDDTLAEDVTQETFIRVYRRLHTFRFRSKFSTWIMHVARNAGTDELRARQRRTRLVQALEPGATTATTTDASRRVEIDEALAALAALSPRLRETLLLVELFGFTYREAAAALGVPEGTAKRRVFEARRQLARALREEGAADAM